MKEYLSKQLMMLAILLFSGISGAFADNETFSITATSNHPNAIQVYFSSYGNYNVVAESGVACELTKGSTYRLHIRYLNSSVYSISSIVIDNNEVDVKDQLDTEEGIIFNDDNDHTIIITLAKAESKGITVEWGNDNDYGSVIFVDDNNECAYAYKPENATSTTVELAEDKNYNMYISINNPLLYSFQASVNGSNITESYNKEGYYPLPNDVNSVTVNFQQKSQETKYITVKWNTEVSGANVTIAELLSTGPTNNAIHTSHSESSWEVAAGTGYNYRITITPNNPLINYVDGIKIGNTNYGPITSPDGSSYFDISNLTDDITVEVTLAKKETKTITVTWSEGCNGIEMFNQNDFINPDSYEDKAGTWVLPTGSTYQYHMIFTLSDPFTYCPSLTIAGTNAPVYATWKENNGWYEYDIDIENLSSEQQIDVSLAPVQTQEVTVDWGSDNHITVFFEPLYGGETIYATNGQPCQLAKGRSYEMRMEINKDIYELKSIQVDEGDNLDDYNDYGFISFPTVNAAHTVNIGLKKKEVDTNTITVTWNNGDICSAGFHDNNWNWYSLKSGVPIEFPKNSTIWLKGIIIDPLLYGIESVTVDNEDVTTQVNNGNEYEFENLSANHTVNITFGERSALKKNITVQYDENHASADINILNGENVGDGDGVANNKPREVAAGEGFNYRVVIRLGNPQQYGISTIQVDGTDAEFTKTSMGGYVDIIGLTDNTTVTVTLEEKETKTVTVTWGEGCEGIGVYDQYNYYIGADSYEDNEGTWVLTKGSTYSMIISLSNPSDYFATVKIGEGDPVNATWNENYNRYEYEIETLSDDLEIEISSVPIPTNEIAITWVDGCNIIDIFDQNKNSYIGYKSYSDEDKAGTWVLPTGSTCRLIIYLSDYNRYCPSLTIGNNAPVFATWNEDNGRYEFDIENLSSDQQIAISLAPVQTKAVTVEGVNNYKKVFFEPLYGGETIYATNGEPCYLLEGRSYNMQMEINEDIYELTSIQVDGGDNLISDYTTNGFIAFPTVNATHTVSIDCNKLVDTNTITVTWNNNDGCSARVRAQNEDWYTPKSGESVEFLQNSTVWVRAEIDNRLVYSIGSATVDNQNVTTQFKNNNEYQFENLSADHTVNIVFNKAETKTVTVNWDDSNGERAEIHFTGSIDGPWASNNSQTELPVGATIKMQIRPYAGFKVSGVIVDNEQASVTYNTEDQCYEYTFTVSDDHAINIVFEESETFSITVNDFDESIIYDVRLNNSGISPNQSRMFNVGSTVTLRVPAKVSVDDVDYKVTMTLDNNACTLEKDPNNYWYCQYAMTGFAANSVHNIALGTRQIIYHNVTVTFNGIYAQLETSSDYYGINSGESYKIEQGESVRLILNIGTGRKLTSVTVNGNSVDYKAGGIVLTEGISGDIAVSVVTEEVESYYVSTTFSGYSQATIFMESDLFEKQVTYGSRFNAGSDVTVTIVPSIGYKVSELVLINEDTWEEDDVNAVYDAEKKEYSYVIENLANDCRLRITTAKRSMVGIDDQSYTLNDIGMGTYCSEYDLDFSGIDDITAYIASGFDPSAGSIVLTKVYKVPAGTGIIIKGTPGNYSIPVAATKFFYSNMLVGVVTATQVDEFEWKDVEYTNYILLKKADDTEPTFYRSSGNGNMPANRAYLQIPSYLLDSSNNNSRITAVFDDDVTPIEDIQTNSDNAKDDDYYNLNGQKVKTVKKGIYIKNGKKVIIR